MLVLLVAATLGCGDLCSPQALYWYSIILEEGGYGRIPREQAAFLIRERDGSLTMQPWAHGEVRRASFRGGIPARAIAVVHTHPAGEPDPSRRDRSEAQRLGMPVIVVTPQAVIAAMPEGGTLAIAREDGDWWRADLPVRSRSTSGRATGEGADSR